MSNHSKFTNNGWVRISDEEFNSVDNHQFRLDLDYFDDEICGLFGQDDKLIYTLPTKEQEWYRANLQMLLDKFRAVREKHNIESVQ